jgi:hypothetical protein
MKAEILREWLECELTYALSMIKHVVTWQRGHEDDIHALLRAVDALERALEVLKEGRENEETEGPR